MPRPDLVVDEPHLAGVRDVGRLQLLDPRIELELVTGEHVETPGIAVVHHVRDTVAGVQVRADDQIDVGVGGADDEVDGSAGHDLVRRREQSRLPRSVVDLGEVSLVELPSPDGPALGIPGLRSRPQGDLALQERPVEVDPLHRDLRGHQGLERRVGTGVALEHLTAGGQHGDVEPDPVQTCWRWPGPGRRRLHDTAGSPRRHRGRAVVDRSVASGRGGSGPAGDAAPSSGASGRAVEQLGQGADRAVPRVHGGDERRALGRPALDDGLGPLTKLQHDLAHGVRIHLGDRQLQPVGASDVLANVFGDHAQHDTGRRPSPPRR